MGSEIQRSTILPVLARGEESATVALQETTGCRMPDVHHDAGALSAGVDVIAPGCAVSPECPEETLREMTEAVGRWHERRT